MKQCLVCCRCVCVLILVHVEQRVPINDESRLEALPPTSRCIGQLTIVQFILLVPYL